uniref:Uncharacterized protein n=1 Tax=Pseudonaja textilis TaxID=8673 RepID=A0A670Z887_PSETE
MPPRTLIRRRRAAIISETRDLGDNLWKENSYIKDIRMAAKGLNVTNCWLCMHVPGSGKGGVLLHGVPLSERTSANLDFKHWLDWGPDTEEWNQTLFTTKVAFTTKTSVCYYRPPVGTQSIFLGNTTWESEASNNIYHKHLKYFPLPDGLWLLCGDTAYQQWPKDWSGVCTIGHVIPVIYKLDQLPKARIRNRREVDSGLTTGGWWLTQLSRAALPPLGVAMNYRDLHILNNFTVAMFNNTVKSIKMLNEEVSEIRQITLQNRYALDIMLAAKGGVCALIHSHCCIFIHNYEPNITKTVHDMEDRIAEHEAGKDGFDKSPWALLWDWLPDSSWLRSLLQLVVTIVIILIMLCCCIQCIPNLFQICTSVFRTRQSHEGTVSRD